MPRMWAWWTTEEERILAQMRKDKRPVKEIAGVITRHTPAAIYQHCIAQGVSKVRPRWTRAERGRVEHEMDTLIPRLAQELDRTENAVKDAIMVAILTRNKRKAHP